MYGAAFTGRNSTAASDVLIPFLALNANEKAY